MKEKGLELIEKKALEGVSHSDFAPGDRVSVHFTIREGGKERVQIFEGDVIRRHSNGASSTFTVRKISFGVGVERIFPLYSPLLKKVVVKDKGKVRRAKLYYLRELRGRAARIKTHSQIHGPTAKKKKKRIARLILV